MLTGKIIGLYIAEILSGIIAVFVLFDIFMGGSATVPPVKVYALVLSMSVCGIATRRLADEASSTHWHHHYEKKQ